MNSTPEVIQAEIRERQSLFKVNGQPLSPGNSQVTLGGEVFSLLGIRGNAGRQVLLPRVDTKFTRAIRLRTRGIKATGMD